MNEPLLDRLLPIFEEDRSAATMPDDPQAARVAARLLYVEGLLREVFPRRRSRRGWITGLAAAAGLVVAATTWLLLPDGATGTLARLDRTAAGVSVLRGGSSQAIAPGMALGSDDEIRVPRGRSASIRFADGTRFELGPETRVRLGEERTTVEAGVVEAQVSPQAAGRPVILSSPHAEARVLGTKLRLDVGPSATRLQVFEGKVRFARDGTAVEVAGGQGAVAGAGLALKAAPLTRGALLVAGMVPGSWASAPDTPLRKVAPSRQDYPKIQGQEGVAAVLAKSGGALDTRRNQLLVWGGGFIHYAGNEVYAFKIDELKWERLTDPAPDPALNEEVNADGTPVSRDSYHGLAYVAHADRLFACGGVLAGRLAKRAELTWTFDPEKRRWQRMEPAGRRPPTGPLNLAAYDPFTRKVWWGEENYGGNGHGLYSYDLDADAWTRHTTDFLGRLGVAVDTRRNRLLFAGRGMVLSYDLSGPAVRKEVWETRGGEAFLSRENPGLDYDPVGDRFVGWAGEAVWLLDPETRAWRSVDAPGGPPAEKSGVFGRWRYVPAVDAFILATDVDRDVFFFKPPRP